MMHWINKRPQVVRRKGGVTMQEVRSGQREFFIDNLLV